MKRRWKKLTATFLCGIVLCTNTGFTQIALAAEAGDASVAEKEEMVVQRDGTGTEGVGGEEAGEAGNDEIETGAPQTGDTGQEQKDERSSVGEDKDADIDMTQENSTISDYLEYDGVLGTASGSGDVVFSGNCGDKGDNVKFVLDSDGVLTISGSGDMESYGFSNKPWDNKDTSVKTVIMETGVTSIGDGAFSSCSFLTNVSIADSVTSIGDNAFSVCRGLTSISIPDGVVRIGEYAFSGCSFLTNISIPDSVTSIGNFTFYGCSSLTSAGPTGNGYDYEFGWKERIPSNAFRNCDSLTSISIPDSVTNIGDNAFSGCSSLTSAGPTGGGYDYEFGWKESIPSHAFGGCDGLTNIRIPDSVTSIGDSAFWGCSGLTSISIPDSVTSIGDSAFWRCSGLTSIIIPDSTTSIMSGTFGGCSGLTSISIPDGVTSIGDSAFEDCSSLTSINIPDGVTSIGDSAFEDCSSLTSINIPESVTSIGYSVFRGCSLTSAGPTGGGYDCEFGWKESIPSRAFYGCSFLTSISIPDGVTSIGDYAFKDCSNLTSINIPDGVTSIGGSAFENCSSLVNISIPDSVINIGNYVFFGCNDLISAGPIGGGYNYEFGWKERIPHFAFYGDRSLTNISIPDGVTSIGYNAFFDCSGLTSISIPDSVTSIEHGAFEDCSGLTSIQILNPGCQIYDISTTLSGNATIYGYSGSTAESYAKKYNRKFVSLGVAPLPDEETCIIIFDANGGTGLSETSRTVKRGQRPGELPSVVREGYIFTGWYKEAACTTLWDFEKDTVDENTTLYAGWREAEKEPENFTFTVIFDLQGKGTVLSEYVSAAYTDVKRGSMVKEPTAPTAKGYQFTGWYKEAECTTLWDFEIDVVNGDTTLYAGWKEVGKDPEIPTCILTFDLQGKGNILSEYTSADYKNIKKGSTIKEPTAPTAEGYIFTGWYKEAACATQWDFAVDTVDGDTTLYAGWILQSEYEGVLPGDTFAAGERDGFWVAAVKAQTYTGKAIKPEVHVYDQEQRLEEGRDYTLTYKNNIKVPVATAKKAPCVTVKGKGSYTGTYTVAFAIGKAMLDESHLVYTAVHPVGKVYTPAVIKDGVLLKVKMDYVLTYENNDTGKVTKKAPTKKGEYTMHVSGRGSCKGEFSVPYKVTAKDESISITKAKASVASMAYRGTKPEATLTLKNVGTLKEGTDYTVRYANTGAKGTATAIFTGIGKYSGVIKKTFKVKAAPIAEGDVTMAKSAPYQKGGAKLEILVTVDGVKLTMGVDYTVSYKNNKKAGKTATVTIKGKGNYSGKVSRKFQVTAAETEAGAAKDDALQLVYMEFVAAAGL